MTALLQDQTFFEVLRRCCRPGTSEPPDDVFHISDVFFTVTPSRGCNTCWPCYLACCMCLAVVPRAYPHDVRVYQAAKGMNASYDVLLQ